MQQTPRHFSRLPEVYVEGLVKDVKDAK